MSVLNTNSKTQAGVGKSIEAGLVFTKLIGNVDIPTQVADVICFLLINQIRAEKILVIKLIRLLNTGFGEFLRDKFLSTDVLIELLDEKSCLDLKSYSNLVSNTYITGFLPAISEELVGFYGNRKTFTKRREIFNMMSEIASLLLPEHEAILWMLFPYDNGKMFEVTNSSLTKSILMPRKPILNQQTSSAGLYLPLVFSSRTLKKLFNFKINKTTIPTQVIKVICTRLKNPRLAAKIIKLLNTSFYLYTKHSLTLDEVRSYSIIDTEYLPYRMYRDYCQKFMPAVSDEIDQYIWSTKVTKHPEILYMILKILTLLEPNHRELFLNLFPYPEDFKTTNISFFESILNPSPSESTLTPNRSE